MARPWKEEGTPLRAAEFLIRDDETVALDWAALRTVGPRGYEIAGASLTGADEPSLTLTIDASKVDDVEQTALQTYREIRELARLSLDEPPRLHLIALVWGVPLDADEHIFEAQRLARERRFETATVEAQTFFEMHVRDDIEALAAAHGDIVLAFAHEQRNWSLRDPTGQRLYTRLLDSEPAKFEEWNTYVAHTERRNGVVHRGKRIAENEAQASIDVVVGFHRHMRALTTRAFEALGGPDPRYATEAPEGSDLSWPDDDA